MTPCCIVSWIWGAVLATGGALVAGCGPRRDSKGKGLPRRFPEARAGGGPVGRETRESPRPLLSRSIHEMDGEPRAATEEYYQAALLDPTMKRWCSRCRSACSRTSNRIALLTLLLRAAARPERLGKSDARLGLVYSQLGKADQADRRQPGGDPRNRPG